MTFELEPSVAARCIVRRGKSCPRCDGRGWILKSGEDWGQPCERCGGRPLFRTVQLARLLRVNRRDVYKVDTLTAGSKVGLRVLNALARVFPEAFA